MMGEITGRKVFLGFAGAFGIIITVNIILAVQAVRTFPGLEVANSYVASQEFDAAREAQLALGWDVTGAYSDKTLSLEIIGPEGAAVEAEAVQALVGWATSTKDDFTPVFGFANGKYSAPADMEDGNWNIRLNATAADGTEFRQRLPIFVRNGSGETR